MLTFLYFAIFTSNSLFFSLPIYISSNFRLIYDKPQFTLFDVNVVQTNLIKVHQRGTSRLLYKHRVENKKTPKTHRHRNIVRKWHASVFLLSIYILLKPQTAVFLCVEVALWLQSIDQWPNFAFILNNLFNGHCRVHANERIIKSTFNNETEKKIEIGFWFVFVRAWKKPSR